MTNLAHKAFRFSTFSLVSFETFLDLTGFGKRQDCLMTTVCCTVQQSSFCQNFWRSVDATTGIRCWSADSRGSVRASSDRARSPQRRKDFLFSDLSIQFVHGTDSLAHRSLPAIRQTHQSQIQTSRQCELLDKKPAWTRWKRRFFCWLALKLFRLKKIQH